MRVVYFFCVLFLSGCSANLYSVGGRTNLSSNHLERVYVTNSHHPSFKILKQAKIYQLTEDPNSTKRLTLLESHRYPSCGMPMISSIFTLGLLPVSLDASEDLIYRIDEDGDPLTYRHKLNMKLRVSVWESLFKPFKSGSRTRSKALSVSERKTITADSVFDQPSMILK